MGGGRGELSCSLRAEGTRRAKQCGAPTLNVPRGDAHAVDETGGKKSQQEAGEHCGGNETSPSPSTEQQRAQQHGCQGNAAARTLVTQLPAPQQYGCQDLGHMAARTSAKQLPGPRPNSCQDHGNSAARTSAMQLPGLQ